MAIKMPSFLSKPVCFLGLSLLIGASPLRATVYYASPTGSDSNNGTSTSTPWKTLAKVSGHAFVPGDQMLFQSGQTFAASTSNALTIDGYGTSTNLLVFGIYGGTTPAVISQTSASGNGIGFAGSNSYVEIENLTVAGPFTWSGTTTTVDVQTPCGINLQGGPSYGTLTGITIQGVTVYNFRGSGIRAPEGQKVATLSITGTQVYQVGASGIHMGDDDDPQGTQLHTNINISNCYVYDTRESGILVQCAKTVSINGCVDHDSPTDFIEPSGSSGAPYGIWMADVSAGIIQYCEVYNNTVGTATSDAGGMDLDGGCQDCIIQYCYSHDNDGPGYLQAHWANAADGGSPIYASQTLRNTIRYSMSINDTRKNGQAALSYWSENAAATLDNRAYNNLIVETRSTGSNGGVDQFYGTTVGTAADPTRIYNNIFISDNSHYLSNTVNSTHFIIDNNIWWSLNGTFTYKNNGAASTLAATDPAGIESDPLINGGTTTLLTAPTVGYADNDSLQEILAPDFQELVGSPATDKGLNLTLAAYGSQNVGTRDFFGTSIPQNTNYDIGPYERIQPGPALANDSFETPSIGTGAFQYNPVGGTWTFSSNSGIQSNGSTWGAPAAPNGTQTAFLGGKSGVNGTISQTVNFPATGTFEVTFQSALRTSTSSQTFTVQIDGTTVGTFTPTSGSFTPFATNAFTISTSGNHTLAFIGTGTASDCTDFIDNVGISSVVP
jgi:hypothetical protein